jgi:hypothetical protein
VNLIKPLLKIGGFSPPGDKIETAAQWEVADREIVARQLEQVSEVKE